MKQKFEACVVEDNGGGLSLFVFDEGGIEGNRVRYAHFGYEYNPGQLSQDIQALLDGGDPLEWEGNVEDPQKEWDALDNFSYGWEIVAQVHHEKIHLFPQYMGKSAEIEFIPFTDGFGTDVEVRRYGSDHIVLKEERVVACYNTLKEAIATAIEESLDDEDIEAWHKGELTDHLQDLLDKTNKALGRVAEVQIWGVRNPTIGQESLRVVLK